MLHLFVPMMLRPHILRKLTLNILGPFALLDGTEGISLGGPKLQALLAYLALQNGRPVAREVLAELFWGDRPDKQARQSLREALFRLKRVLAGAWADCLELSGETVILDARALTVDALNFDPAEALNYKTLLKGLSLPQSGFTAWLTEERARFDSLASTSLESLSAAQGDPKQAVAAANKWIALDPLNEAAQRRAMEIEIASGDRIAALQRYKGLTAMLARELGIEPDARTQALADTVRTGRGEKHVPASDAQSLPVVAVLPFENLSGDREQGYFASGITDELISALSLSQEFITLSRNASSELARRGLSPAVIARELGANYTLQGGVRQAGTRLRVLAQLIDTENHRQIWGHRFEGTPEDIFDFQDEIVDHVAFAIGKAILDTGLSKANRRQVKSLDAYDLYVKGMTEFTPTHMGFQQAISYFEQCLDINPRFLPAIIAAGTCQVHMVRLGFSEKPDKDIDSVRAYLIRAEALEPGRPGCLALKADLHMVEGNLGAAKRVIDTAAAQFPHDPETAFLRGLVHMLLGETREALAALETCDRLRPAGYNRGSCLNMMAVCHLLEGDFEESLELGRQAVTESPHSPVVRRVVAAALALLSRHEEAQAQAARILEMQPDFSIAKFLRFNPYKMTPAVERYMDGLRQAGIPDI